MTTDEFTEKFDEAICRRQEGDFAAAAAIYRALLNCEHEVPEKHRWALHHELGGLFVYDIADYPVGEKHFRIATSIRPRSQWSSIGLFHALVYQGRGGEATREMERLLALRESPEYELIKQEIEEGRRARRRSTPPREP